MNLRILKKLSRRAAPLLPLLGDTRQQFPAEAGDNYIGIVIRARKHWERGRSAHGDTFRDGSIKRRAADGRGWVYMHPPGHPRAGTIMVGGTSGGEEPEWSEESAWEALYDLVWWAFADCDEDGPRPTRSLATPSKVFAAAAELVATCYPAGQGGRNV